MQSPSRHRRASGELYPRYELTRHLTVGAYYLYSYGVEPDVTKNTHFLSSRASVTNIDLSTVANDPLRTNVLGGEDFIWNVSLRYAFE